MSVSVFKPNIYTTLHTNRRGIYFAVLEAFNLKKIIEKSSEKDINTSATVSLFEQTEEDKKVFRLIISEKNWDNIKPVAKQYNNRRYLKLKSGKW